MESLRDNFKLIREADASTPLSTLHLPLLIRFLVGIGAPTLVFIGIRRLLNGVWLPCLFHEATGLSCPGCGSGRAVLALLHGRVLEALGYNPLLFLLGLPSGLLLIREYLRFVFPGLGLHEITLPAWIGRAALTIILCFWVLRNIPAFKFLAP